MPGIDIEGRKSASNLTTNAEKIVIISTELDLHLLLNLASLKCI